MIRLEQIRLLETKINKIVERIKALKDENKALRKTLDSSQAKMQELEKMVEKFKSDQDEIEQTILKAIQNLDSLEDELAEDREPSTGDAKSTKNKVPADRPSPSEAEGVSEEDQNLPFDSSKGQQSGGEKELEIF